MQAVVASRCIRARDFLLRRRETMAVVGCSRISCHSAAVHFRPPPLSSKAFTTCLSLRAYQRHGANPHLLKRINGFLSDSPPRPPQIPVIPPLSLYICVSLYVRTCMIWPYVQLCTYGSVLFTLSQIMRERESVFEGLRD